MKSKRVISLLLCAVMVLALLPTFAFAASAVNTVQLTITPPAGGMMPADATVPADASTVVTDTRWDGLFLSSGKFGSGGYGVYITVRIKDGQDKVFADAGKLSVYVNGAKNKNSIVTSVSADKKEIVVFADFKCKVVDLGVTGGMKQLKAGDPIARNSAEEKYDQTYDNITVRSIPESPDGTVQPYSWIITEMDVHAKEGYLLTSVENALKNAGKKVTFNRYDVLCIVGTIEYKDPWNVHVIFYQWIGASKDEKLTDQMKQWQKTNSGMDGSSYTEIGTAKLRDYLAPLLSSEYKKPDNDNNIKDLRAYAYKVPSMASGSIKWARVSNVVTILDEHAETKFPGAVGQWYMIKQGNKVGYIPAAYVEGSNTPRPPAKIAYPSTQTVDIDGRKVEFQMYALKDANGYPTNYIKARDLALALNGTQAQFAIEWDGRVNLVAKSAYTPNGSENKTPFSGERAYTTPTSATNVNGSASDLTAIFLTDDSGGGYTYYQLRDLGRKLGFNVDWSGERGAFIETDKPYNEK